MGTQLYCAPEVMMRQRYNESADTFSFSLVLLCLAVGDIDFIVAQARKDRRRIQYTHGKRPVIPYELEVSAPALIQLIEEMWNQKFRKRPSFSDIVPRLAKCTTLGEFALAAEDQFATPADALLTFLTECGLERHFVTLLKALRVSSVDDLLLISAGDLRNTEIGEEDQEVLLKAIQQRQEQQHAVRTTATDELEGKDEAAFIALRAENDALKAEIAGLKAALLG